MIEKERLMTYQHYANMKGVVQQTVRDWVKDGKVNSINIDGRLFVVLTDKEIEVRKDGKTY